MRNILLLAVLGLAGQAPDVPASARAEPVPEAAASPHVRELLDLARSHSMLLVGELHGTVEAPRLLQQLALALAAEGHVVVGLEWPTAEQPRVDSFLSGDTDAAALTDSAFWRSSMRDGRSSLAMLDLLTSLRRARVAGAQLQVVCFDGPPSTGNRDDREAGLAEHLRRAHVRAGDAVRMLVLTGNYHARLSRGTPWDPEKPLMGYLLRDLRPFNVDVKAVRGGAWVCLGDGGCGVHEFDHSTRGLKAGWLRHEEANPAGYLSTLILPVATPSPPAFPETPGDGT